MSTKLDPRKKYLFAFAHPDDDVGIAGTMRLLVRRVAEVHCVWATSGDFFGQGQTRETETYKAMRVLGLSESNVHLLRFGDLSLVSKLDEAVDAMADLLRGLRPDIVYANAYEGGHPDHDSVNFMVSEGSVRAGLHPELFEFPLYNGSGSLIQLGWRINSFPDGGPEVLHTVLDEDAVRCKYGMMQTYSSQWMYMVPARLASSRWKLTQTGEPYRPFPLDRDYTLPPHKGRLGYERWFNFFMGIRFRDFRNSVMMARKRNNP
ncbi:MAG: PIG-L family deacetylase [Desulfomonile tiedjei]|uniref:PIG-L family deacetylase n=1 Tax=Desulfomonile tiedjei TaxID=2358 RepID=A0A9D6V7Y5_9BACT|nr:PIG-L family deacetylase [Desulfomonile tiedjei]